MLHANIDDRAEILAQVTLTKLTRKSFKQWELSALAQRHSRQRQIVESETALVILDAKRCIRAWKLQAVLRQCQLQCQSLVPRSM